MQFQDCLLSRAVYVFQNFARRFGDVVRNPRLSLSGARRPNSANATSPTCRDVKRRRKKSGSLRSPHRRLWKRSHSLTVSLNLSLSLSLFPFAAQKECCVLFSNVWFKKIKRLAREEERKTKTALDERALSQRGFGARARGAHRTGLRSSASSNEAHAAWSHSSFISRERI